MVSGSGPTATFTLTSSEDGRFECRIDGAPFAACGSPYTTPPLATGRHTFEARAIDASDNVDPTPATYAFEFTPSGGTGGEARGIKFLDSRHSERSGVTYGS